MQEAIAHLLAGLGWCVVGLVAALIHLNDMGAAAAMHVECGRSTFSWYRRRDSSPMRFARQRMHAYVHLFAHK